MRVLFIGNSHTYYNDMPELFRKEMAARGILCDVTMLTKGGQGFEYHVKNEQTRFNILFGHYEYVVLQHRAQVMGEENEWMAACNQLNTWIRQAGSTGVLYETWEMKGNEALQPQMSRNYEKMRDETGMLLAPVGDVWQKERLAHPDISFYQPDNNHATEYGSHLAAKVIADTIFQSR